MKPLNHKPIRTRYWNWETLWRRVGIYENKNYIVTILSDMAFASSSAYCIKTNELLQLLQKYLGTEAASSNSFINSSTPDS